VAGASLARSPSVSGTSGHGAELERGPLADLVAQRLVLAEDLERLPLEVQHELQKCNELESLLPSLVQYQLLTEYQAARISAGKTFGLVLDHYRILDRLGSGGMGIVFRAEHVRMRRIVAVKALPFQSQQSARDLARFYAEIRAVSRLRHPNIVTALDAGEVIAPDGEGGLHYYVMEYVEGQDLERLVEQHGPLPIHKACDYAYQIASALHEAHKHHLVHRDIKPSNIIITPEDQAKLLDFGLVRHFEHRLTEPGTILGTVDYIAPEQARDASTVDIRADIYGLGATLFWCLTGRTPFPSKGNLVQDLAARQTQAAPAVRTYRPEVKPELEAVVTRLMAVNPDDRYPTPQAVMAALFSFIKPESQQVYILPAAAAVQSAMPAMPTVGKRAHNILIVDDEPAIRLLCRHGLQAEGLFCEEASNGPEALALVGAKPFDLVLLDMAMPGGMTGLDVCRRLRENPPTPHLRIIVFSGHVSADDLAQVMLAGADDFLTKPFSILQLQARVKAALRLKDAQDRATMLNHHLLAINRQLEENLNVRHSDLVHARNALVLGLAKLVDYRDAETGAHLMRLQRFSRRLAEEAMSFPAFRGQIDQNFIETLECCAPLHDIGKVGLPDHILLKEGRLDADERIIMQTHTVIGSDTLREVLKQHGQAVAFLQMAIDIARHHHERWDGTGYPDRLAGADIPLAARIVAVGDVYDALRSRRVYKPALSHQAALQVMLEASPGHFDPVLLQAFRRCADDFDRIFRDLTD